MRRAALIWIIAAHAPMFYADKIGTAIQVWRVPTCAMKAGYHATNVCPSACAVPLLLALNPIPSPTCAFSCWCSGVTAQVVAGRINGTLGLPPVVCFVAAHRSRSVPCSQCRNKGEVEKVRMPTGCAPSSERSHV